MNLDLKVYVELLSNKYAFKVGKTINFKKKKKMMMTNAATTFTNLSLQKICRLLYFHDKHMNMSDDYYMLPVYVSRR